MRHLSALSQHILHIKVWSHKYLRLCKSSRNAWIRQNYDVLLGYILHLGVSNTPIPRLWIGWLSNATISAWHSITLTPNFIQVLYVAWKFPRILWRCPISKRSLGRLIRVVWKSWIGWQVTHLGYYNLSALNHWENFNSRGNPFANLATPCTSLHRRSRCDPLEGSFLALSIVFRASESTHYNHSMHFVVSNAFLDNLFTWGVISH